MNERRKTDKEEKEAKRNKSEGKRRSIVLRDRR
jgi:hypothetical protein